jgi:predicted TPR repeat methyltransferase
MRKQTGKSAPALTAALAAAMSAHREGRLDAAARSYRAVLSAAPAHPDALHYLGVLLHQQGERDAALALIKRALAIAPGYTDARNNLGNMQKELGHAVEAEQSFRAVIAARPKFAPAWNNLGVVLKAQERYAEAADAYRHCLALDPGFADCWTNLGNALRADGDLQGAMTAYYEAIQLAPQSSDAYRNLGRALVTAGRNAEALDVYRQWQARDPSDTAIGHLIAALADGPAPARASDDYVQATFDRFAGTFDEVLAGLDYRAPALCAALVDSLLGAPAGDLAVLDAGCGTGLCGPALLPYASTLDGVDLSPKMLEKAALRNCYRRLEDAELTAWLAAHPASYDLIVSADTLCYFGALTDVTAAAAGALREGGHFVFTLEKSTVTEPGPPFVLHPHGRYSHAEAYARQVLAQAGMTVLTYHDEVLRTELGQPVAGLLIAARRPIGAPSPPAQEPC